MKRVRALMIGCVAIAATAAIGQMSSPPPQPKPQKASPNAAVASSERGQQVFKQNCSRCHQEPQSFSPSISGTIAKHMRVRAGLSDDDYKALMKFLNP
jgi:cytochrome c5